MIKDVLKINQHTLIARVHKDKFTGEVTEVEKVAEELGQYGNIISYKLKNKGNLVDIIFTIDNPDI